MGPVSSRPFTLTDSPSAVGLNFVNAEESGTPPVLAKEGHTHRTRSQKSIVLYLLQVTNKRTIKFYTAERCFMESLGWWWQWGWIPTWALDIRRPKAVLGHLSHVHSVLLALLFLKCKSVHDWYTDCRGETNLHITRMNFGSLCIKASGWAQKTHPAESSHRNTQNAHTSNIYELSHFTVHTMHTLHHRDPLPGLCPSIHFR